MITLVSLHFFLWVEEINHLNKSSEINQSHKTNLTKSIKQNQSNKSIIQNQSNKNNQKKLIKQNQSNEQKINQLGTKGFSYFKCNI